MGRAAETVTIGKRAGVDYGRFQKKQPGGNKSFAKLTKCGNSFQEWLSNRGRLARPKLDGATPKGFVFNASESPSKNGSFFLYIRDALFQAKSLEYLW